MSRIKRREEIKRNWMHYSLRSFSMGAGKNGENASCLTPDDVMESNKEVDNMAGKFAALEKTCQVHEV